LFAIQFHLGNKKWPVEHVEAFRPENVHSTENVRHCGLQYEQSKKENPVSNVEIAIDQHSDHPNGNDQSAEHANRHRVSGQLLFRLQCQPEHVVKFPIDQRQLIDQFSGCRLRIS